MTLRTPMPRDSHELVDRLCHQPPATAWLWFFDFDGTLVDLAPHPSAIHLVPELSRNLARLSHLPGHTVAIVSGRPMADLARYLLGQRNLWLAGDHGAEIKGPDSFSWHHPQQQEIQRQAQNLAAELGSRLQPYSGVWLEPKPTSLSIHYRQAPKSVTVSLRDLVQDFPWGENWTVRAAQSCYEVRALNGPTKRDAVRVIRQRVDPRDAALCLAFGDDLTDEDMFAALPQGITVKVGSHLTTQARYHVDSAAAVRDLIHQIVQCRTP